MSIEFSITVRSLDQYTAAVNCPGFMWGQFDCARGRGDVHFHMAEQAQHAADVVAGVP